ncbi:MAG: hypothetical protein HUK08_08220, partial [Bacteroidaceae bacterium]|nr:hypothetical protein [Bacteroidaceae bacterium]
DTFAYSLNKAGFDYYSFYMQMKGLKLGGGDKRKDRRKGDIAGSANGSRSFWLDNIVAGRFRAGFGMGLVMNNGFSLGKSSMISSGGRISTGLSPHSSTSDENYLQGAGVTFAYRPDKLKDRRTLSLSASLFGSSRYIDATITDSATISTILTSAYHRTRNEINKKNSAVQSTFGGDVSMSYRQFSAGVTAVYTHLNTPLTPNKNPNKTTGADSYRLYYAEGCNFFNASVHYAYKGYKLSFQGETAFAPKNQARSSANASGGVSVATINNLSYRPSYSFKALLLHRYYSYDYTALYAKSLATNSNIQDENGVMASISWQSKVGLTLNYYIDYSHFNHPKYLVSKASNALENSLQASWSHNALKLLLNCRLKNRQYDNADKSGLAWKNTLTLKLQSDYAFSPDYSARLTLQYNRYSKEETQSHGFMVLANGRLKPWRYLCIDIAASYFNTDDYNSVIYAYERALRYRTGYSQYYGKGMHCGLTLSSAATKWLSLGLKFSGTKYFDRSTIGSSMDTIDGSAQATISFEAAVKI